jgi:hypothetical protein
MTDGSRHLRALENAATEAQRVLEGSIASVDQKWNDAARRGFEAEHLAAIRSDARLLRVELGAIAQAAQEAVGQRQLAQLSNERKRHVRSVE